MRLRAALLLDEFAIGGMNRILLFRREEGQCGFAPEKQNTIHAADGELVKQERGAKKAKATMAEKQQFYSELLGYQSMKGWSDGRVAHVYRDKYGVWPNSLTRLACEPSAETKKFIQSRNIAYAKGMKHAA
jgi:DNA repair protein RadD